MKTGEKVLLGKPEDDPDWVKEIASQISLIKKKKITDINKKLLRELFLDYQRDGLSPRDAIEKAKNVIFSFLK